MGVRLLLDTHVLVWWLQDDARLSSGARDVVTDPANRVLVSSVSVWELATKHRIGKWPDVATLVNEFEGQMEQRRIPVIDLLVSHARLAGLMAGQHRDPFDRMLVAQSIIEEAVLVTNDDKLAEFGGRILWAGGTH